MTTKDDVSKMARQEYDELYLFIENLENGINQKLITKKQFRILIGAFQKIAEAYYNKADDLIQKNDPPASDKHDYARILNRLREHALLLGDLIRNYPVRVFKAEQRQDLQRAFMLISRRLKVIQAPVLLPVLSPRFRYSHFYYVGGFGFIGIPPEMSITAINTNRWVAIWHEVSGYAMAVTRETRQEELEQWVSGLHQDLEAKNLWTDYRDMYNRVTDTFDDDLTDWQTAWLLEFLEDLFFYIIVKQLDKETQRTALRSMFAGLSKNYSDSKVGDPAHPPTDLRLLVVMAYLRDGEDITELNQDLGISPDWYELAKVIVNACAAPISSLFNDCASGYDQEKEFARIVLEGALTWEVFHEKLKGIDPKKNCEPNENCEDLIKEINEARVIEDLLEIKFNCDDLQDGPSSSPQYYVTWDGGKTIHAYNETGIRQLVKRGLLTQSTLVWRPGMPDWATAGTVCPFWFL